MTNGGLREVCKAKEISGYSRMNKGGLIESCCEGSGLAEPENLKWESVELPPGEAEGLTDKEVVQKAFRELLRRADAGEMYTDRAFSTRRRSCYTGSLPGRTYRQLVSDMRDEGWLYLPEGEGDLDGSCARRCLRQEGDRTCGVRTRDSEDGGAVVLFFANYLEGRELFRKAYEGCPNEIGTFWEAAERLGGDPYTERDTHLAWQEWRGDGIYGTGQLETELSYGCEASELTFSFGRVSEKYDDRAFGGADLEYDRPNYRKLKRNEEEILEDMGFELDREALESALGEGCRVAGAAPAQARMKDKSFEVVAEARIECGPVSGESGGAELAGAVERGQSELWSQIPEAPRRGAGVYW
jgi:hypothetical protein